MKKKKFTAIHIKHENRIKWEYYRNKDNQMDGGFCYWMDGKAGQIAKTTPSGQRKCVECGEKTRTLFFEI